MNLALAIHVFRKAREQWRLNLVLIVVTTIGYYLWSPKGVVGETDEIIRAYPMGMSMCLALFAFHFTEGARRAGFGSFPARLFVLPVSSFRLVAVPMGLSVLTVLGLYLLWARGILPLVNVQLRLLWPCLFLVAATLGFQALVWALARFQTAKLFGLGIFGTLMACSWVLLKEEIATAMVHAVSPALRVEQVVPAFLAGIALLSFAAGLVTVYRQRHRAFGGTRGPLARGWRSLSFSLERKANFATPAAALFWHEWRLQGRVLPMCVALVCGFLLLLTSAIEEITPLATVNVMLVLVLSPITLAAVLGAEFGKPNFWSRGLAPLPYLLTQPIANGAYVWARVKVAALSVAVSYAVVALTLIIWITVFANAHVIGWLQAVVLMSYDSHAWLGLVAFGLMLGMVVALRLLCEGMWLVMLGRDSFYALGTYLRAGFGISLVLTAIFVPDWEQERSFLVEAARVFSVLLCGLSVLHGLLIAFFWSRVEADREFGKLVVGVAIFAALAGGLGYQALTEVHWLRLLSWQVMLWCFPLLACGLGIAARRQSRGTSLLAGWRWGPGVVGVIWAGLSLGLGVLAQGALPIRVDAGGPHLRMLVRGEGKPVVVLEQFGPGPLEPWAKIQNRVAKFTTVVAYEHAGGIATDAGPRPRDAKAITGELRRALRNAGLQPPFVLVGHSFGGPYIRVFAGDYPDDVAALALVDPSTEEFFAWLRKERPQDLPVSKQDRREQTEIGMNEQSFEQAAAAGIPQVPTVVLSGARPRNRPDALQSQPRWLAAHSNWVARLPDGEHIVSTNSGHAMPFEEPDLVVQAIRQLVDRLR